MSSEPKHISSTMDLSSPVIRIPDCCTETVNMVCAVCPKMHVTLTGGDGIGGLASRCGQGHWDWHAQHNRLWRGVETHVV